MFKASSFLESFEDSVIQKQLEKSEKQEVDTFVSSSSSSTSSSSFLTRFDVNRHICTIIGPSTW
jgi:hypothetical protein